ncbi:hypothetical protein [Micromonospora sp. DPT]|uniref:hypothetical protein n=1 Tax=Micromonospora sp. DPT TaxID=3142975 RepID=UPI0032088A38
MSLNRESCPLRAAGAREDARRYAEEQVKIANEAKTEAQRAATAAEDSAAAAHRTVRIEDRRDHHALGLAAGCWGFRCPDRSSHRTA